MTDGPSVQAYLDGLPGGRGADAAALSALMAAVTGEEPTVRGRSIVGFGTRHYRSESGREGDTARIAFAPRAGNLVLYVTGYLDGYADLLERLGPHRRGKGCLYLRRLSDADDAVLRELVARSYRAVDG